MEYGTYLAVPKAPAETAPADGISVGGVLTLAVAVAVAVVLKRTGRPGVKRTDPAPPHPQGAPAVLPSVSLDQLRSEAPQERTQGTFAERGKALLSAPAAKAQAHHLGIPSSLSARLQTGNWDAMCRERKLSGLKRGDLEKTPYGVAVHVEFGKALDFASVQRGIDQIETGLDTQSGSIRLRKGATAGRGILDIRLRDPLENGVPWEQPSVPVLLADPLRLAVTAFGDVVELDVKQRIGVFGTSGSGKSCVQRLIGAHVAQAIDAELEIWDLKFGVESQHYCGKAHRVTSVGAAVSRLDWLLDTEFPRRASKMKERGVSEWKETPWDRARVVMIDEGNGLVRGFGEWREGDEDGQPAGAKGGPLKRLFTAVEQGRALGVYFVWATQYPKASSLPTEIRSQLNVTVCMKLRTDGEARVVFGDDAVSDGWAPQDLYGPGWLLVQDDTHTDPVDSKAVWLPVDIFRSLSGTVPDRGQDGGTARTGTVLETRTPGQSLSGDSPPPSPVLSPVPDRTASTVSLDVWTVLLLSENSLSLSELSRRTGRAKSSVHAAVKKMTEDRTLVQDGDGYRIRVTEEK